MTALILASGSKTRQLMLKQAGLEIQAIPSHIDEDLVKVSALEQGGTALTIAETLAELKALQISTRYPDALVFGCDQTLECGGQLFDKPKDRDHAYAHLKAFSGKSHTLHSSIVAIRGGQRLWHYNDAAHLSVRPLSDAFINQYLDQVGDAALSSVGAYQLEGQGAQLFSKIDGNYFTILGLPLLPLLDFLREQGALPR